MGKKANLNQQLKSVLYSQFSKGQSRHQDKIDRGTHIIRDKVYSKRSLDTHLSREKQFIKWQKEHRPDIKSISQIDKQVVMEYLKYGRDVKEYSAWTQSADMGFFNRVCSHWDSPLEKKDWGGTERKISEIKNNRSINKAEAYSKLGETHRKIVDFGSCFGLRRGELVREARSYSEPVRTNSMYEKDGRIYISTIGKGGRHRNAVCLKGEHEQHIRENYGQYITQRDTHITKEEWKDMKGNGTLLFKSISRSVPIHQLCRQTYADNLLQEVEKEKYDAYALIKDLQGDKFRYDVSKGDKEITINEVEMKTEHAHWVSTNLGHNRTCILKHYVNVKG